MSTTKKLNDTFLKASTPCALECIKKDKIIYFKKPFLLIYKAMISLKL